MPLDYWGTPYWWLPEPSLLAERTLEMFDHGSARRHDAHGHAVSLRCPPPRTQVHEVAGSGLREPGEAGAGPAPMGNCFRC